MFRDDRQAAQAISKLLKPVHLHLHWTEFGPSAGAVSLLRNGCGPWSHGEILMFRAAFDFWSGQGNVEFSEMLAVLDPQNLRAICSLAMAVSEGPAAVQAWIDS